MASQKKSGARSPENRESREAAGIAGIKPAAIGKFHRQLQARIGTRLNRPLNYIEPDNDWHKATADTKIFFNLEGAEPVQRGNRSRSWITPLWGYSGEDQTAWVAWSDEWISRKDKDFDLIGASLAFYWGAPGPGRPKDEILRAEWDNIKHRGGIAAQPHWHLDTTLMTAFVGNLAELTSGDLLDGDSQPMPTSGGGALTELPMPESSADVRLVEPTVQDQALDIHRMHLGMGGWHHSTSHPGCWQSPLIELEKIVEWADLTLALAIDQFKLIRQQLAYSGHREHLFRREMNTQSEAE